MYDLTIIPKIIDKHYAELLPLMHEKYGVVKVNPSTVLGLAYLAGEPFIGELYEIYNKPGYDSLQPGREEENKDFVSFFNTISKAAALAAGIITGVKEIKQEAAEQKQAASGEPTNTPGQKQDSNFGIIAIIIAIVVIVLLIVALKK